MNSKYTRSSASTSSQVDDSEKSCYFCVLLGALKNLLRNVCTFELDASVRKCAFVLQDQKLLAKLSARDLLALEASYHSLCITSLYKRAETVCIDEAADTKFQLEGTTPAAFITYIEDARESRDSITVFKLVDLANVYTTQMEQLGADKGPCPYYTTKRAPFIPHSWAWSLQTRLWHFPWFQGRSCTSST